MQSNSNNGQHHAAQSPPPAAINYDSLTAEVVFQTSTNPTNRISSPSTSSATTAPSRESPTAGEEHGDGMDLVDPSDGMEFHSMVPYAPQEEWSDNPTYNQYSWSFVENDQLLEKVHGHPEVIQRLGRFSSPYMIQEFS